VRPSSCSVLVSVFVGATIMATVSTAPSAPSQAAPSSVVATEGGRHSEHRPTYDVRQSRGADARAAAAEVRADATARPELVKLQKTLGRGVTVDMDGTTGTPRWMVDLRDGHLTTATKGTSRAIVTKFVQRNLDSFGLASEDLDTFRFRDAYRDVVGVRHLSWTQVIDGAEVFGNGLRASVDKRGRILTIGGAPVPTALVEPTRAAELSAAEAVGLAKADAGDASKVATTDDRATEVLVVTRAKTYRAWRTITMSSSEPALSAYDATTGQLLFRRSLSADAAASEPARRPATGVGVRTYPGAPGADGRYLTWNFTKRGWLKAGTRKLRGNNVHAYSDLDGDDKPTSREEVRPTRGRWNYRLKPFKVGYISYCQELPCSWHPNRPFSWRKNRKQNVTQMFIYANNFHDHLERRPIGFTEDAGNFQRENFSGKGQDGDAVLAEAMEGANSEDGLPDASFLNNANMDTPPDGMRPRMQYYLQHFRRTPYTLDGDPFPANNTGDEADTVYHEYVHGLSNRLVLDPTGNSGLTGFQGNSMGEAWSDWYALDYLVASGDEPDAAGKADVRLGKYDGLGQEVVRTAALDCPVGVSQRNCDNKMVGHRGGYTYGDVGNVIDVPEVHADGEIWAQALWDIRDKLGVRAARMLVTRAMEYAPVNPSFLDMRNAILVADHAAFRGMHVDALWEIFATRGMGFYAGSLDGDDVEPAASLADAPAIIQTGSISGTVTDSETGELVPGTSVTLAFQGGGRRANPTAVTKDDGSFAIKDVPVGTYPKLVAGGAGYEFVQRKIKVKAGATTAVEFTVRRDWAAASGGAEINDFTGPDFGDFGCGPDGAIDLSLSTGWGSTTGDDEGTPTNEMIPKHIVVQLPDAVDVSGIGVDPGATCGDGASAGLGEYQIELSANGTTWTVANEGTFLPEDSGRINDVTPTAGQDGAKFLRLTMLGNQVPDLATDCPDGGLAGCEFTDLSEITVYGVPAG
jgi:extracellular elastinolytic metalloproteinase